MQKSDKGSIPFDLSHNRILTYDDYGEYLDEDEAANIRKLLKEFVLASQENKTDSPLYTYLALANAPGSGNCHSGASSYFLTSRCNNCSDCTICSIWLLSSFCCFSS